MKKISQSKAAGGVIAFFVLGLVIGLYFSPPALKETVFVQRNISALLPAAGYTSANVSIDGNRVLLQSGCDGLSFDVTDDQALSIRFGLEKTVFSRPLTHDILRDILDHYEISVESVSIDSFEDEIYTAKIVLRQGGKVLNLDARPSDSIALAVRLGIDIKIKEELLQSRGVKLC